MAFPTETFYGLAVAALDAGAVRAIFPLKGRPRPSPSWCSSTRWRWPRAWPRRDGLARDLMARYWPGALTLVLPRAPVCRTELTAGTGTIGVRLSSHPVACGLVRRWARPMTAPSANPGRGGPRDLRGRRAGCFPGALDLVLDGGATREGRLHRGGRHLGSRSRVMREGAVR